MRDLLRRIWRYLNYPSHLKQLARDTETFKIKFSAAESDLRYLKVITVAIQNQLNSIQDHLRSSQPWLPSQQRFLRNPECLLLRHLSGFLANPCVVEVGGHNDLAIALLLDSGFNVYLLEPDSPAAAKLRNQFKNTSYLQVIEIGAGDLGALAKREKILADSGVLRISTGYLDQDLVGQIGELRPEILEITVSAELRQLAEERPAPLAATGGNFMRQMRANGYRCSLVLFEINGEDGLCFAANSDSYPEPAQGNLFFFKESRLFDEAYRWTQTIIPRFRHRERMPIRTGLLPEANGATDETR